MEMLLGKTLIQLQEIVKKLDLQTYTARQLSEWLYKKFASSFEEMTNISKESRNKLLNNYIIGLEQPIKYTLSSDGTKKFLYKASGNKFIESAYIPDKQRATLCVSSQVGCKMGCVFCATGKQGFMGQLTSGQILNQIISFPERDKTTNIVYMGMGEPLDNIENVLNSLEILTSDWGFGWSPRRITVSTIGIIPAMKEFINKSQCHLAVSLHSPFADERSELMPIQSRYSLFDVIQAIKKFDFGRQRRVSFEYIVFNGLNDTQKHVNELAKLLNGIHCRINLIRFHEIPGSKWKSPDVDKLKWFNTQLNKKGIITTIRASRGQDIEAACGLLATTMLKSN